MAIFLLLPDEGGARNALASRYITQMYSALGALARDNGGRLWVPVWFLLDEFGNIPRIPGMDTKLTVAAGRGIRFLLALQDLAQLKKYGDASQTITGNCDTWLFLRTADVETAKVISAKLGTFTVRTSSHSMQSGSVSGRHTQSEGATARPLLTPDEVLRWPSGHSLLIQSGEYPADMPLQDLGGWRSASAAFQPADPPKSREAGAVPTWLPGAEASEGTEEDTSVDPAARDGGAEPATTEHASPVLEEQEDPQVQPAVTAPASTVQQGQATDTGPEAPPEPVAHTSVSPRGAPAQLPRTGAPGSGFSHLRGR